MENDPRRIAILNSIKSKQDEIYNIEGGFVEMNSNKTVVLIEGAETVK